MRKDDASRLAREILRELVRKERSAGTSGFLSYKLLRRLMVHTQLVGIKLEQYLPGPWIVGEAEPGRFSRSDGVHLPTVERGGFQLQVPDHLEAVRLAGFLNWCNVPEPRAS